MNQKALMLVAAGLAAVGCAFATTLQTVADRENPDVNSRNRLPPRAYSMPLASERDALTDALEPETPYRKSLNGTWKLSWAGSPDLRVRDFWQVGFDDSR